MLRRYRQHTALPTPLSALPIRLRTTSRRPIDGTMSLLSSGIARVRARRAARRRSNSSSSPATRCHVHSRRDGTPIAGRQRCLAVGMASRAARQSFGHRGIRRNVKAYACMLNLLPVAAAAGRRRSRVDHACPKTSPSPTPGPLRCRIGPPNTLCCQTGDGY